MTERPPDPDPVPGAVSVFDLASRLWVASESLPADMVRVEPPRYPTITRLLGVTPPTTVAEVVDQIYGRGLIAARTITREVLEGDPLKARATFFTDYRADLGPDELGSNGTHFIITYGSDEHPAGGFANCQNIAVQIRNSSSAANEAAGTIAALQVGTDVDDQTPVSLWGASYSVRGPVGIRPGFLGGYTAVVQNHHDGPGSRSPNYAFAAITYPGIGDGADFYNEPGVGIRYADTFPVDYGFIVTGASGAWLSPGAAGYHTAYKAGGWVTPWKGDHDVLEDDAAARAAWSPRIGIGLDVSDWVERGVLVHPAHPDAPDDAHGIELRGTDLVVTDDGGAVRSRLGSDGRITSQPAEAPDEVVVLDQVAIVAPPVEVDQLAESWSRELSLTGQTGFCRYYTHLGHGHCELRLTGGRAGTAPFTLPAEVWPDGDVDGAMVCGDGDLLGAAMATVSSTTGAVTLRFDPALPIVAGRISWRLRA